MIASGRGLIGLCAALAVAPASFAQQAPGSVCSAANVAYYLSKDYAPYRTTEVDIDRFFAEVSATRFEYYDAKKAEWRPFRFPALSEESRAGTRALLEHWNAHMELRDYRWLAYALGTAFHETAYKMHPVRETLADTDEGAIASLNKNHKPGNAIYWNYDPKTGKSYFGRGYVQITWSTNYQKADAQLGRTTPETSFYQRPELALDVTASSDIAYDGMVDGWFTLHGDCLLRYFMPNQKSAWRSARRIINGEDRWDQIGRHSEKFLQVVCNARVGTRGEDECPGLE